MEGLSRRIQLSIMTKVMDTYFETTLREPGSQFTRHAIFTFRHEIERRAKTKFHLHFRKGFHAIETSLTLNVVCQNESKLPSLGPTRPTLGFRAGALVDGPYGAATLEDLASIKPPYSYAQSRWEKWLCKII